MSTVAPLCEWTNQVGSSVCNCRPLTPVPSCSTVPMLLNEALPELSGAMEASLLQTRGLAWRYTALLEMLAGGQEPAGEKDQSPVLLRQALYNVRQHEALLKAILVGLAAEERRVRPCY